MSELNRLVFTSYELAKKGRWDQVISDWTCIPLLGLRCSRYQREKSGWTFLHQAAYFGHQPACQYLIKLGAPVSLLSHDQNLASDVARTKGYVALADWLDRAIEKDDSLWAPPKEMGLHPSSCHWDDAKKCRAVNDIFVAYANGLVRIPIGSSYFVDDYDRILVGWHGTFDPPCGMDGEPLISNAYR